MPRKKKEIPEHMGAPIRRDDVFQDMVQSVEAKLQKKGLLVGDGDQLCVLPVPAFILRYLLQMNGLPLSCIYQVVGPEGCYKSTFAMEMLKWHRLCGGGGHLNEAETKSASTLRDALLNYDTGMFSYKPCTSLEDWQRNCTWYTEDFQKKCSKADGPGRTVPFCMVTDSLTGKASEHTLKNIDTIGHAQRHFAVEAQLIADYMRSYPQKLLGWPMTFVGVNHMKIQNDPTTGMVDYNIPGGWALKFQCAAIIEMERMGKIQEFSNYKAANVRFHTIKNSYGPNNVRINVRFKSWQQEDAPGVNRLHCRFEWWEAGILFLATGQGLTQARAKIMVPKMREVCDVKEKSGGSAGKLYYSKRLDVSASDAMPAHDLGLLLERRTDVLSDLYGVLGISQHRYFQPGIDFLKYQEGYGHIDDHVKATNIHLAKLEELRQQQAAIGPTEEQYPQDVSPPTEWPAGEE